MASCGAVADVETSSYRPGQTALIAKVPDAEPLVSGWRRQFDTAAAAGVPAHVTVLYPFLDCSVITASVVGELQEIIGGYPAFSVRFPECRRFPHVLYLAPVPDARFRAVTAAVAARWPEAPPYGGQFEEVVPHVTVAHGQDGRVFDKIEASLSQRLPIAAHVSAIQLLVFTGEQWHEERSFPLGR